MLAKVAWMTMAVALVGCKCSTFQANGPEHEALFGGAYGEGHDPCDERGTFLGKHPGDDAVMVVFGAPYPALAFTWLTEPIVIGTRYTRLAFQLEGEAGWLDGEAGWLGASGEWSPDVEAWFDPLAVRHDAAVLSAGGLTFTDDLGTNADGNQEYRVEGQLVWGNPASADAAWYSWEGKDVWAVTP